VSANAKRERATLVADHVRHPPDALAHGAPRSPRNGECSGAAGVEKSLCKTSSGRRRMAAPMGRAAGAA
jgi:hypothetical protein